jgi:hypothetical protein
MKTNMGIIDRVLRAVVAVVIIGLYSTNVVTGTLGIVLIVLSIVFLLTAFIGFCPLYLPLGINTRGKKK